MLYDRRLRGHLTLLPTQAGGSATALTGTSGMVWQRQAGYETREHLAATPPGVTGAFLDEATRPAIRAVALHPPAWTRLRARKASIPPG